MSIVIFLFSFFGILGGLGFAIGKPIFSVVSTILGNHFALLGLFFCLVVAIVLWIISADLLPPRSRTTSKIVHSKAVAKTHRMKQADRKSSKPWLTSTMPAEEGIPLPAGKLVNLHGFNHYFSSPEWVEIKDIDQQQAVAMNELGNDFPSYFGTNETFLPKRPRKMTLLKGLDAYFEDVDQEEQLDRMIHQQESNIPSIPGSFDRPPQLGPIFKSQMDQEEFLAQYKLDSNSSHKGTQEVDSLMPENRLREDQVLRLKSEPKQEFISDFDDEDVQTENNLKSKLCYDAEEVSGSQIEEQLLLNDELKEELVEELEEELPPFEHKERNSEPILKQQETNKSDNPSRSVPHWHPPDLSLLDSVQQHAPIQDLETPKLLEKVLLDFGVKAKVIRVTRGPVITRYELAPAPGVKISKIVNLADDIALGLAARDVRIEAPIPGKAAIGIEVPNKQARSVPFREVLETESFGQYPSKLKVALGKDIADQPIIADLVKMPHLLVAGATGSGKSVCITSIINSILFNATPDQVKFLLVDPKMVELNQYNGIPHLLAPVVVDPKKAASALKWIVKEMENRYELFAAAGVRDVDRYNKLKSGDLSRASLDLPYIVVIIDELADLMLVAPGEVEEAICRLAQMARAAGIHLVIATQRPSVDVITGVIKANIPSRISFAVSSQIDSRTILDATGAEKLLGRGDMLYSPLGVNKALRVQGCLVTDEEVNKIIAHWKSLGRPEYLDPERLFAETTEKSDEGNGPDDALFFEAGQLFIRTGMASVSFLQRRLKLGYTRAARLMDMLEEQGVVGAFEGSKPRQVLITMDEFLERFG